MHVKCSTTTVPNSIKIDNLVFGSEPVSYGPTSSTGFYNGIDPPISGYTIYYATSGMTVPSIVVAHNDTEAIYWAKAYGGDTTNLLYDNGVINWSITNLGGSIVSMSTIITNSKYRITCATGSTFRFYALLSKLINGQTYTLSYKYNIISGTTFNMTDWNDTPISNINNIDYVTYKFSSATGSKATYDSTYRFMNFSINTGAIVDIWDVQLEQKSSYTPFTNGTRAINSIEDGLSYMKNSDKTVAFNINHSGIVTNGLIINLDAGMVSSYPRSGNTWYDLSGNNNGTLLNSTLYSNGSILFNSLNSNYVNIGNISTLDSGDITIDFWAKSVNSAVIIGKHYNNFEIRIEPTYFGGYVGISSGWKEINDALVPHNISTYATNINNYTYIFSYTKNYINFYSNGTYRGTFSGSTLSATITHFTTGQSLVLGQRGDFTGYLSGEIPIINIYNREITEIEVIQNYNARKSRFGL